MKKTCAALFVAALATASIPGWASTQIQGSVTRISPKAHQLTLDGTPYQVERGISLADLAIGDKVSISAEPRHDAKPLITRLEKTG